MYAIARNKTLSKQEAANTARIAHQISQGIHNLCQQATALAQVAEVFANVEKEDESKEIFNYAVQTAHKIESQSERVHSFKFIALSQAMVEYFPSACQTADHIEWPGNKSEVIETIAKLQVDAGQREEAKTTLSNASKIPQSFMEGQRFIEGKRINIICREIVLESVTVSL